MPGLADRLRQRILQGGPMTFAAWMEACLYDPQEGHSMRPGRKTGPGGDADFATSPTLHPFMGAAVAQEAAACWERLGRPAGFTVTEFGGGEGDLARHALAWLDGRQPGLAATLSWRHVEVSPFHRAAQAGDPRLSWPRSMPATPAGFVVAHEFLDALPFHWLEGDGSSWREVRVGESDGRFVAVVGEADSDALAAAPDVPPAAGLRVVAMPRVRDWLADVGRALGRGGVLVVDYGERGERLWGRGRPDGTVRGFRGHAMADVLGEPGRTDITASVDFALTRAWAEAAGLSESSFETQEAFLLRHGILEALNATPRATREGASDYLRLRQLLLPTGLGAAFKVQRLTAG